MGRINRKTLKHILAVTLCALISFAYISVPVYAVDDEASKDPAETIELIEAEETQTISEDTQDDADNLLKGYMDSRIKTELSGAKRKAFCGKEKAYCEMEEGLKEESEEDRRY